MANNKSKQFVSLFTLSLVGILLIIAWFYSVTPRWHSTEIIFPDLFAQQNAPEPLIQREWHEEDQGLFWIKFTIEPQIFTVNKYRIRTLGCVNSISTNGREWNIPPDDDHRCENFAGIPVRDASYIFKEKTDWAFAGYTNGGTFGVFLDKDWSDPRLIVALTLLALLVGSALYLKLPVASKSARLAAIVIFLLALGMRFWGVFIKAPPEMFLYSDMGAYYGRGVEMLKHVFYLDQIFQPLGYTVWSLGIRLLGGWELYKWIQVFLSWGTVLIIFLMSLEFFGIATALIAAILAGLHIPFIGFASFHMSECAYIFMLTFTLWFTVKTIQKETLPRYFILGLLLMASFYFKASHSFFIPLFCLWILYRDRAHLMTAVRKIAVMGVACLIVAIPHLIFTSQVFNKPYLGPTAGGMNFVMGKCQWKANVDADNTGWLPPLFNQLGETAYKRWPVSFAEQGVFYKAGLQCIHDNPYVMIESFRYIYYLFTANALWPVESSSLIEWYKPWLPLFEFGLLPLCLLGLITRVRDQNDYDRVASLMMLSLFLMVYIFYSENRYRVPFDGILIVWASCGITWICRALVRAYLYFSHLGTSLIATKQEQQLL